MTKRLIALPCPAQNYKGTLIMARGLNRSPLETDAYFCLGLVGGSETRDPTKSNPFYSFEFVDEKPCGSEKIGKSFSISELLALAKSEGFAVLINDKKMK